MSDRPHILIVASPYYAHITGELVRGAIARIEAAGATCETVEVPGVFEIATAIAMAMGAPPHADGRSRYDGYVALGCVIRGETTHYDYVCTESARALQDLAVGHRLPLGYGIVTVENERQAIERAFVDRRDKGGDAAAACLAMYEMARAFNLSSR
jgi:6,7-dimethyl-8-ribityllumazine synthase